MSQTKAGNQRGTIKEDGFLFLYHFYTNNTCLPRLFLFLIDYPKLRYNLLSPPISFCFSISTLNLFFLNPFVIEYYVGNEKLLTTKGLQHLHKINFQLVELISNEMCASYRKSQRRCNLFLLLFFPSSSSTPNSSIFCS